MGCTLLKRRLAAMNALVRMRLTLYNISAIQNMEWVDQSRETFLPSNEPNYQYTVFMEVDEASNQMWYRMTDHKNGGTGRHALDLVDSDSPHLLDSLMIRAVCNSTATLVNDCSEMLVCSLVTSGLAAVDKIPAAASLGIDAVGLIASAASAPAVVCLCVSAVGRVACRPSMYRAARLSRLSPPMT